MNDLTYSFMRSPEDFGKFLTNGTNSNPDYDMIITLYDMVIVENANPYHIKAAFNTGFYSTERKSINKNYIQD